jgi:light-regulated signal transduction histidine kinase (bacteriophytochrome)
VRASVAPNLNTNNEIIGMVLSLLDVTRLRATTQMLEETLANLRRSNEDLAQFAYAISHDLQAPLRKITIFTEIIKSDTESELTGMM